MPFSRLEEQETALSLMRATADRGNELSGCKFEVELGAPVPEQKPVTRLSLKQLQHKCSMRTSSCPRMSASRRVSERRYVSDRLLIRLANASRWAPSGSSAAANRGGSSQTAVGASNPL